MVAGRLTARGSAGRRGAAALEFAMVAPVFLLFLMAIFGAGLDGMYQLALDDAVRVAARQVQIGGPASASGGAFVAAVCGEFGLLAGDCQTNLSYSVQSNQPPAAFAALLPVALSSGGVLPDAFATLAPSSNVLVEVAYPLPFAMPLIGKAITYTGTNSILSVTTVTVEPHG